jgi:hypothetical protein
MGNELLRVRRACLTCEKEIDIIQQQSKKKAKFSNKKKYLVVEKKISSII